MQPQSQTHQYFASSNAISFERRALRYFYYCCDCFWRKLFSEVCSWSRCRLSLRSLSFEAWIWSLLGRSFICRFCLFWIGTSFSPFVRTSFSNKKTRTTSPFNAISIPSSTTKKKSTSKTKTTSSQSSTTIYATSNYLNYTTTASTTKPTQGPTSTLW